MGELQAAFYGDDFTGSVDALLRFSQLGWKAKLFASLPTEEVLRDASDAVDVVGIAGIARSLSPSEMDAELRPILTSLAALNPRFIQYKACSTADSSPDIGNLGKVIELARELISESPVPMVFAQPDFGRFTVFGHHFAAEENTVYRLDRQPNMSRHPATPMRESDLARHIGNQTSLPIGSLHFTEYRSTDEIADAIRGSAAAGLILDTVHDDHLRLIGDALQQLASPVFAIGSGGLSRGIALASPGSGGGVPSSNPQTSGPILCLSGSRSTQTRRQVAAAAKAGWLVRQLAPEADGSHSEIRSALSAGRNVMLTSDDVQLSDTGSVSTVHRLAETAAAIARTAVRDGLTRRVYVCGGDTSSRVMQLLDVRAFTIAANPWDNIVLLRAHSDDPTVDGIEVLLKGGQVGDPDLFIRLS